MRKKQLSGLMATLVTLPAMANNAAYYYQEKFEEVNCVASAYYQSMTSKQRDHCHNLMERLNHDRSVVRATLQSDNVFLATDALALYRETYREVKTCRCLPPTYIGRADNRNVQFDKLGRARFGDAAWLSGSGQ